MKNFFLFIALTFCLSAFSQKEIDTIKSQKLNESRIISISLPPSYKKNKEKKYPLLLLMDGDYLFDPFNGALFYGNYWDDLPEVIIVGIDQNQHNERETDCTVDEESGLPNEKGAKFFDFINVELMPALEKKYRIAPFKIIAGHDITAGFINLFLYKDDPTFNAYISLSPELGPQMEERIPLRLSSFKKPIFYYQSTADGDLKKSQERIKTLDTNIKAIKNENLYYNFDEFKNASHYSLVLYSIPNALYHIFSAFQPISTTEYTEKIAVLPNNYIGYLTKKYDIIERTYGMKMPIRVTDFKAIEAAILKNNAFDEFQALSALSKKSYPKSMLSQYHMAMYYEKTGDAKNAAKAYQNAYLMEEIGDLTKDMMLEKADELKKGLKK